MSTEGGPWDDLKDIRCLVQTRRQVRQAAKNNTLDVTTPDVCNQESSDSSSECQSIGRTTPPIAIVLAEEEREAEEGLCLEDILTREQIQNQFPKLALEQRGDPRLAEIILFLVNGRLPSNRSQARHVLSIANQYIVDEQGVLRKIDVRTPLDQGPPAVLPRTLWDHVLKVSHVHPMSGHRKYRKMLDLISANYYFPGMSLYIKAFCLCCSECERTVLGKKLVAPLRPYYASYPGIIVHID